MRGEIRFEGDPLATHAHKIEIFWVYRRFDGVRCVGGKVPVVGENDSETEEMVVEVVVTIVWEFVWSVHVVEYGIEEEEEVVEEVVEVVAVVELAVREVESEETYQRAHPYDEMAQRTSFWRPFLHCLSSSLDLSRCPWALPQLLFLASFWPKPWILGLVKLLGLVGLLELMELLEA